MAQGIDVRATSGRLQFRALLQDSAGAIVTSGTTNLRLYELQDGGTLESYDFNDNTFKTTALTTENLAMTHRTGNNGGTNTGIWTVDLTTLTGFVAGNIYFAWVTNAGASPVAQVREFQFGSAQGDLTVSGARLNVDVKAIDGSAVPASRLSAALTTGNGIDINLEQALDTTPTADTTGDALFNGARSLPNNVLPGANGGLPTVDASNQIVGIQGTINNFDEAAAAGGASTRLINTTSTASSTTTQIYLAAVPGTDADFDYDGMMLIIYDASNSNRPSVHTISNYEATDNVCDIEPDCRFTPANGDPVEVWAVADSSVAAALLAELAKVTTGFSAANPNNLNSYVKALASKVSTVPSGFGTYDPATDSLEVLRERLDLMAGAGFSTATDSLEAIRDAIDDLIAPVVAQAGGSAGVGFLSECVSLIRKATDEPSVDPKYTNSDLIEYIHSAFDQILSAINIDTDHPILCRFDVEVVNGTQEYVIPCTVGEIWRVAKIDETTRLPVWELWPSNEFTFSGYGFTIEGNILRFGTPQVTTETLQVLYLPNNEASIHTATCPNAGSTTTIEFEPSPTEGTYDIRPHAYLGYLVRLLQGTGAGQERLISAWDVDTSIATVRPNWTTAPDDDTVYEVLPQYSRLIKHLVSDYAACDVLSNEAKTVRRAEIERRIQRKMTALRNTLGKKVNRFGTRGPGVDTIDNQDLWPMLP